MQIKKCSLEEKKLPIKAHPHNSKATLTTVGKQKHDAGTMTSLRREQLHREEKVDVYQRRRLDLIGRAQLHAVHFCMGLHRRLGSNEEQGLVYKSLNSDAAKIICQFLILDAAAEQLFEHDLRVMSIPSNGILYNNEDKVKLAQMVYHLYLTSKEEEECPRLLARVASSREALAKEEYRDLPEIVWETRSRIQANVDALGEESVFVMQLHPSCRLHKMRLDCKMMSDSGSGCIMEIHDADDYTGLCMEEQYHMACKHGNDEEMTHPTGYVEDILQHIVEEQEKLLSPSSDDSCPASSAAASENIIKWLVELFVLQACVFCIETDDNKITFRQSDVDIDSSDADTTSIFLNFCNEYHEEDIVCEGRGMYTWVSNLEFQHGDELNAESDCIVSINTSCINSHRCEGCNCRWCTTFEERMAMLFFSDDVDQ